MPVSPFTDDGIRIDPPPSLPVHIGTMPAATAAPLPPLDPPAERSVFHGLRVAPNTKLVVSALKPYSGVLVLPTTMHPDCFSRSTKTESLTAIGSSACTLEPFVVRKPAASSRSFTPIGTPARGPRSSPAARRRSS